MKIETKCWRMAFLPIRLKKLLIFAAAAALAGGASAQNVWEGGISDDWNNTNNWTYGAVPTSADNVQIFTYGPNMPLITNAAFTGQLTIGKYDTLGRLTVDVGGALTTSSYLLMTEGSGDTAILENSGTVAVNGDAYLNQGVTTLLNNGYFSATGNMVLAQGTPGLSSSTVTNNGQINVGVGFYLHDGTATLVNNVGGTITNNGDFLVAFGVGSTGTVINAGIITAAGVTYAHAGNATIVNEGSWNTATFLPGNLATCQAIITNTGTITATGTMYLTGAGNTVFNMEAGTVTVYTFDMQQAGTGHLNLHGGTILTTFLNINGNTNNTIDVTAGKLIVNGNRKPDLDWMASVGLITAYGGNGIVIAEYDSVSDTTTLSGALPLITGQTMLAGGSFQIDFSGAPSQPFRVLGTNLLTAPVSTWPVIGSGIFDSGGNATFTDSNVAAENSQRFYRIVSP